MAGRCLLASEMRVGVGWMDLEWEGQGDACMHARCMAGRREQMAVQSFQMITDQLRVLREPVRCSASASLPRGSHSAAEGPRPSFCRRVSRVLGRFGGAP